MQQFFSFAIPGVPYGCTYALFAVGLVLTYQATGVFNFGFGAQAFASAFAFMLLAQNAGWPVWLAFAFSVFVMAPALGLVFNKFLFSRIATTNSTAKTVTGIAILVGLPALLYVVFGNVTLLNAPTVLFNQNSVYFTISGYPVNGQDLTVVTVTVVVLLALMALLRWSPLGLQMRAAVESKRLVQLGGVNGDRAVAIAWAVSSWLAGLAGVLLAPYFAVVQSQDFVTLMVAAIAAAALAGLRSLPLATLFAVLLGVASLVLQGYLPTQSLLYSAALPALPFVALIGALLFVPALREIDRRGDPLASVDPPPPPPAVSLRDATTHRRITVVGYVLLGAFVVSMLTWMPRNWENVFNSGLAFATIFLSITLITGMGGQLSLAQATLAGVGAFTAAQLALHFGLNMALGMLVGAAVAAATATVLALLSLRLKGLGLALMTLAAALFFDSSVFPIHGLTGGQAGISLEQSWVSPLNLFSASGHQFFILSLVVVLVAVVVVKLLQKGTVGQYLTAMRGSEPAASSLGINLTWQRVSIFAVSGAIAGVGGTLLTLNTQTANPDQFNYELSLVFVVIVVTAGVSRVEGAIQGAMGFVIIEQLLTYAPPRFQGVTIVLFGAGALTYAAHPEGVVEYAKTRTARLWGADVVHAPEKAHSDPSSGRSSTALPLTESASRGVLLSGRDDYG